MAKRAAPETRRPPAYFWPHAGPCSYRVLFGVAALAASAGINGGRALPGSLAAARGSSCGNRPGTLQPTGTSTLGGGHAHSSGGCLRGASALFRHGREGPHRLWAHFRRVRCARAYRPRAHPLYQGPEGVHEQLQSAHVVKRAERSAHSTVTLFARLRGWPTLQPRITAT